MAKSKISKISCNNEHFELIKSIKSKISLLYINKFTLYARTDNNIDIFDFIDIIKYIKYTALIFLIFLTFLINVLFIRLFTIDKIKNIKNIMQS